MPWEKVREKGMSRAWDRVREKVITGRLESVVR